MGCRVTDMRDKEVICVRNGARLGNVYDVEIDTCTGRLVAIILQGRGRCLGLLGREDDTVIAWDQIEVIGDDTILVRGEYTRVRNEKNDLLRRVIGE